VKYPLGITEHLRRGDEWGEHSYSSTYFYTRRLIQLSGQHHDSAALPPKERFLALNIRKDIWVPPDVCLETPVKGKDSCLRQSSRFRAYPACSLPTTATDIVSYLSYINNTEIWLLGSHVPLNSNVTLRSGAAFQQTYRIASFAQKHAADVSLIPCNRHMHHGSGD
jgi:hypothetical protein